MTQFFKRHGRSGITRVLQLPERITPLPKHYRHEELARFFAVCSDAERVLFATFLMTGFREQYPTSSGRFGVRGVHCHCPEA
jgi:hypothetical protein